MILLQRFVPGEKLVMHVAEESVERALAIAVAVTWGVAEKACTATFPIWK